MESILTRTFRARPYNAIAAILGPKVLLCLRCVERLEKRVLYDTLGTTSLVFFLLLRCSLIRGLLLVVPLYVIRVHLSKALSNKMLSERESGSEDLPVEIQQLGLDGLMRLIDLARISATSLAANAFRILGF